MSCSIVGFVLGDTWQYGRIQSCTPEPTSAGRRFNHWAGVGTALGGEHTVSLGIALQKTCESPRFWQTMFL